MQHARKRIADGFIELSGGMDSGRSPSIIERNKVAFSSNVRFRGGKPFNRPGFKKLNLMFKRTPIPAYLAAAFNTPAQGSTVTITVDSTLNFISTSCLINSKGWVVVNVVNATQVTIRNVSEQVGISIPIGTNITFPYESTDLGAQAYFYDNNFQGAAFYSNATYPGLLISSVGGRIFRTELTESTSTTSSGAIENGYRVSEIIAPGRRDTFTLVDYTVPAVGATVDVIFDNIADAVVGSDVFVGGKKYTYIVQVGQFSLRIRNDTDTPGNTVTANTAANFPIADRNSKTIPIAYFCNAEQFLIIQDGQSRALIFDGENMRRSREVFQLTEEEVGTEIPTGTCMAYGNGRLWVAVNGKYFIAGDIVGGPTGSKQYGYNDSILTFTENTYLNSGGFFRVPAEAGNITAMRFIATPDTSLGQGPLQVFTSTHVVSVNVPTDRDAWKNLQYPIQTVSLISNGSLSDRGTVLINGDIFYRAKDGIRSFVVARRDIGQWGNTPLSTEMNVVLLNDSQNLLQFVSSVVFDNRFLMTAEPVPRPNGCYFKKLVALDFNPISSMAGRSQPAYDGAWNADALELNFSQLVTGNYKGTDRCFFFGFDDEENNVLFEIDTNSRFDFDGNQTPVRIESYFDTRSYACEFGLGAPGSDPYQVKRLQMAELFTDEMAGEVDYSVKYRPDQSKDWYDWHDWDEFVPYRDCDADYLTPTCRDISCYKEGYRARMRLPVPAGECVDGQDKTSIYGYEFQVRLMFTGWSRINKFRLQAVEQEETAAGECRT